MHLRWLSACDKYSAGLGIGFLAAQPHGDVPKRNFLGASNDEERILVFVQTHTHTGFSILVYRFAHQKQLSERKREKVAVDFASSEHASLLR